jgi:hypothetical protein
MHNGQVVGALPGGSLTEEALLHAVHQSETDLSDRALEETSR